MADSKRVKKNEYKVDIPDLGPVLIRMSAKARRISIRLKPFNGTSLIIPLGADVNEGIRFLHEKKDWIKQNLKKLEEKESKLTVFDERTHFKTRSFALEIKKHQQSNVRLQLKNGLLQVFYPHNVPVESSEVQEHIRFGIEEALRLEAKRFLPGRLAWLAQKHQIRYQNVTIKNLKSRWGSCSATNNINLNLHLMRLPDHLIDYVLLHELCHVFEKNHGPHFWARLDIMCNGKAKELDKAMNDYQTKIY
ncbi:MAG: M48 family metallopeptidase [Carboxylicivirga sp.]|jgi:predicted metal-dependent hydrolase|nr:M48 family metallopeptidase [Carboxylicivirga sp.]